MTGIYYAITTAVLYGVFDIFVKLTSMKIDGVLGALIINVTSVVVVTIYALFLKGNSYDFNFSKEGLILAVISGVLTAAFSVTFIKMFGSGIGVSQGISIVRIGMVVVSTAIGALVLKETLGIQQVAGLAISILGLYLILM